MIAIVSTEVFNFEGAIRGARNPMNSWARSDSEWKYYSTQVGKDVEHHRHFEVGENDLKLMLNLATAGSDHGKFLRQIMISVDIEAPIYWWKEFDTYKVGTVANSTSTMHKLGSRALIPSDFSWDKMSDYRNRTINHLNILIESWKRAKEVNSKELANHIWRELIQDLPTSFNQLRTLTLNYEVARNMYFARKNHKLEEWHYFCDWIENLPYSELITTPRKL